VALITASTSLLLGSLMSEGTGLIVGTVLGTVSGVLVLAFSARGELSAILEGLSYGQTKALLCQHWAFCRSNLPHALFDAFQAALVVAAVGHFLGKTTLGFFSMAQRILGAPLSLIGSAVGQVVLQRGPAAAVEKRVTRLVLGVMAPLLVMALFGGALICTIPDGWFGIFLGAEWRGIGWYLMVLSPWFLMRFVVSPVSSVPLLLNRPAHALFWGIGLNLTPLLLLGAAFGQSAGASSLLFVATGTALVLAAYGFWVLFIARCADRGGCSDLGGDAEGERLQ
jgi:O-antigen/teichoic acid export membrane protein